MPRSPTQRVPAPVLRAARPSLRAVRAFLARWGGPLWLATLAVLAVLFVLRQREGLAAVGDRLGGADRRWLAAGLAVEGAALALIALTYRELLARLGHRVGLAALAGLHVRRVLVGTVSPVGGPPSLYVLLRDLGRRGVPADDALLAAGLRTALNYAAFLALLLPALALGHPSRAMLGAAALVLLVFAGMVALLAALLGPGGAAPGLVGRLPGRAREFVGRARGHGLGAADLLVPFGCALGTRLAGAALLFACLRAVGERPAPATAVAAYAVGVLFLTAAPVFGGIGVVEVAVAAALGRLGVPAGPALGAALLCRVAELWLPLALGLVAQARASAAPDGPPSAPARSRAEEAGLPVYVPALRPVPVPVRADRK